MTRSARDHVLDLWPALAYGAAYLPFAILSGLPAKHLFVTALSCWAVMVLCMSTLKLWSRVRITREVLICAVCSTGIILTTILGYGLVGVSMLLMAVLMRGGVLAEAPILDVIRGNTIRPQSRLALCLTLSAILCAAWGRATTQITPTACAVVGLYLACYAVRLHVYGSVKKNERAARSLIISEQPLAVTLALVGTGLYEALAHSQGHVWVSHDLRWYLVPIGVGAFSQFTGVFGSLVLAGSREHTYCAPLNRCMSTLAVALASVCLGKHVTSMEWLGVGLIMAAVAIMTAPWPVKTSR